MKEVIKESKRETLTQQAKNLNETWSDLCIVVDNLNLTEEQTKIIEPVVQQLGMEIDDIQEEIYLS